MLLLKVAPIEFIGIIASIVTAVAFVFVLYFQMKATRASVVASNAARTAADAARTQVETLRPHIKIVTPERIPFQADEWEFILKFRNVGPVPAFSVFVKYTFHHANGQIIQSGTGIVSQDLAPNDDFKVIVDKQTVLNFATELQKETGGLHVSISAEYSPTPERSPNRVSKISYETIYDGDSVYFMVSSGAELERPI